MMKKFMFLMLLMLLCLLTVTIPYLSCEYSNEVVGISIDHYPNRLFYLVGENKLDFHGCLIASTSRSGNVAVSELMEPDFEYSIEEDVDFTKEGIYVVKIASEGFKCQFPVQVISKESLQEYLQ